MAQESSKSNHICWAISVKMPISDIDFYYSEAIYNLTGHLYTKTCQKSEEILNLTQFE